MSKEVDYVITNREESGNSTSVTSSPAPKLPGSISNSDLNGSLNGSQLTANNEISTPDLKKKSKYF
jgi:hypothetical protein